MFSWIRWSGLFVFAAIAVLLAVLWLLVAPKLVEWGIESAGQEVFGAKVDVGEVSLGLSPFSFTVHALEVADKDQPMQNLFTLETVVAQTEIFPLWLDKVMIPEMSLAGLRLGGQRSESGALDQDLDAESGQKEKGFKESAREVRESVGASLPSASEILAREPLKTVTLGRQFEATYQEARNAVDNALEAVPTEAELKAYETEFKAITDGKIESLEDFQARKARLDALKDRIKQTRTTLKDASDAVRKNAGLLKDQYQELKDAPEQDLQNLRSKYQLGGDGLVNLVSLVGGGELGEKARQALEYYTLINDFLDDGETAADAAADKAEDEDAGVEIEASRAEGRYVHFESARPLPDFWIGKLSLDYTGSSRAAAPDANVGVNDGAGEYDPKQFSLDVSNISYQHDLVGQPIRFSLRGNGGEKRTFAAEGSLDRRAGQKKDSITLNARQWPLNDIAMGTGAMTLSALASVDASALVENSELTLSATMDMGSADFVFEDGSSMNAELIAVFKDINQFTVVVNGAGTIDAPELSMNSDLDQRLKAAVLGRVNEKVSALERKLKTQLGEKLASYTGNYSEFSKDLSASEASLDKDSNQLDNLLEKKMDDYQDQLKDKAKAEAQDALQDKLKGKLKGLF